MTISEWIKAERKKQRWSQTKLGDQIGVSQVQVSLWETGKQEPRPEQLEKLRAVLGESTSGVATALQGELFAASAPTAPPGPKAPPTPKDRGSIAGLPSIKGSTLSTEKITLSQL